MVYKYIRGAIRHARTVGAPDWLAWTLLNQRRLVRVNVNGQAIVVRTSTPDLGVALNSLRGEFDEVFDLTPDLRHNLIIDAGGYIGTAAIAFAKRYPRATVVTLEPSPANFAVLRQNVVAFPNIRPLNMALAPASGMQQLFDRGSGEWGFTLVDRPSDRKTRPMGQVETTTVAQIISDVDADGVDILKVDIEGGEADLFGQSAEWVDKVEAICVELHDRIKPGCTAAWQSATTGRTNGKLGGEKYFSMRPSLKPHVLMQ